jgi:MFS family permease
MLQPIDDEAEPEVRAGARPLRALRHRNYKLFFFGQLISLIGTWMQNTALPLLVVQLVPDHPGEALGLVNFVPLIPLVPLVLIVGSLADRFSRHKLVILAQAIMMLTAFVMAYLTLSNQIHIWHVFVLIMLNGVGNAIDTPSRQSLIVDLLEDRNDLGSAIALNSSIFNLGRALGPVIAGFLIAPLGFGAAFLVNGLSFLAVIGGLLLMRLPALPLRDRQPKLGKHLSEGLRYVGQNQVVLILMSLVAVSAFLSTPFLTLMPLFVQAPNGPLAASAQPINDLICSRIVCQTAAAIPFGLLMGGFGLGALVGALIVGSRADRARGRWLTLGNLGFPLALIVFAVSRSFWLSLAVLFIVGIMFLLQNALTNTLLQTIVPDHLRGRLMSIYSLVFQGSIKAGGMQGGFVESFTSAPFSVAIGAVVSLVYGLFVLIRWPKIRRLE